MAKQKKRTPRKYKVKTKVKRQPGISVRTTPSTKATKGKKTRVVAKKTTPAGTAKRAVTPSEKKKHLKSAVGKTGVKAKPALPAKAPVKSKKETRETKRVLKAMATKVKTKVKVKQTKKKRKEVKKKKVVTGKGLKRQVKRYPTLRGKKKKKTTGQLKRTYKSRESSRKRLAKKKRK